MLQLKQEEQYTVVQLDNGIPNALSSELISELTGFLKKSAEGQKPLVLSGNTKFFSMGLNLPELIDISPEEFTDFIRSFDALVHTLYTLPVPVACALEGHAVAGGAILALACDFRIGVNEPRKFGCNEAQLGVPVPHLPAMIIRQLVSDSVANKIIYQGSILSFEEACQLRFLDELVAADELIAHAGKIACQMMGGSAKAFSVMKSMRTQAISEQFKLHKAYFTEQFVQCWYQEASQELIRQAAQHF